MKRNTTKDNLQDWKARELDSFYVCTIDNDRACKDVFYAYMYYFCCCGWIDSL